MRLGSVSEEEEPWVTIFSVMDTIIKGSAKITNKSMTGVLRNTASLMTFLNTLRIRSSSVLHGCQCGTDYRHKWVGDVVSGNISIVVGSSIET
jgi:hypothetical protein